jgi:hypothetical protein
MYVDGRTVELHTARTRDDREHGAHAPTDRHRRCGRLRLSGTKGILVSSFPFSRCHSRRRYFVDQSVSIPARPEPDQPPEAMVGFLRFISQHTLEIYAIQLAGSEFLIKLVPDLAA